MMTPTTYTCRLCTTGFQRPDDIETIAEDEEIARDDCYPGLEQILAIMEIPG